MERSEREPTAAPTDAAVEPAAALPASGFESLLRGDLPRHASADPAAAAQLRRLQRSAGNAAVLRMLRQVAPPAADAAAPAAAGFIVDDQGATAAGQMRRTEFLDEARERAAAAAKGELGLLFTIAGCPWLDHWIDYFRTRSPSEIEAAIRRYAPATAGAGSAREYLAAIEQRVAQGIVSWRETGEMPAAPTAAGAAAGTPGDGATAAGVARSSLLEEPGQPLDAAVGARVGAAFGRDLSGVRVHAGAPAAELAGTLSSRAVTIGRHVAFAAGEYQPGTRLGDALIAHELAHVLQQEGSGVARTPAAAALEAEADQAAGAALLTSYAPHVKLGRRVLPALRTGLTLQSCPGGTATAASFEDAIKVPDYERAATLLSGEIDDAKILEKLKRLSRDQLTKLDAAAIKTLGAAADRIHRPITFLLYAPPAATPFHHADVPDEGALGYTAQVGGGTVEARKNVHYEDPGGTGNSYAEGFSLGYKGPDAEKTRWLQFIWREVIVEHPKKGRFPLPDNVRTSGGEYPLTTDKDKPNYNTDSASRTEPWYEAAFHANRTADSTSMFDMPGSMHGLVSAQFGGSEPATKVTSRAHFTTYLVRDMQVLHKIQTDVEWVYTSASAPPRTVDFASGGAASAVDPRQRERLIQQYPKFAYIP